MGYLIFDGVNDIVSQAGASGVNAGTASYTFRVRGTINTMPSTGLVGLIGTSSSATSSGLALTSAGALRIYAGGTNRYGSADGLITAGVLFDYTVDHASGGAWTITDNLTATVVASGTFTTNTSFSALNQFGRSSSNNANYLSANMEIFAITSSSLTEVWDADLSGGTGSVLPTVSGNNNGTLINFPTDDSQWGGFGGATYTLTAQGGTYSYSGASAGLNRGYMLEAQGATYSYSGASANLTYSTSVVYRLDALGASYSYVGESASLLRDFRLTAQGGNYIYSGTSATLTKSGPMTYRLTALGVTYVYSGGSASLTATGVIPAANPASNIIGAIVGGRQSVNARIGGSLTNNAKIGGRLTINAMVAI